MNGAAERAAAAAVCALAIAIAPPGPSGGAASAAGQVEGDARADGEAGAEEAGAAAPDDGFLAEATARAREALATAPRRPPEPRDVTWRRERIGTVALAGALLDLGAADLTGDGKAEILALAPGEVVALASARGGAGASALEVIGRADLGDLDAAAIRPRAPVGVGAPAGGGGEGAGARWIARSSEWAEAAALAWRGGNLAADPAGAYYPACAGVKLALSVGRSELSPAADAWWEAGEEPVHAARCRRDLVDADGIPLDVHAEVRESGELAVTARPRCPDDDRDDDACEARAARVPERGYAFAIADLGRDGDPEVAAAARRAPGAPGEVEVFSLREGDLESLYRADLPGPVRGIATGDLRGEGVSELVVASAAEGGDRIEIWLFTS